MWFTRRNIAMLGCAAALAWTGTRPACAQESPSAVPQAAQGQQHYWDCVRPFCRYVQPEDKNKPPQPYGGGTPVDVFLNTKFWTDVPQPEDFVKATRPPEGTLRYLSTGGNDISRSKLKTSAELQQMDNELERAGAAGDRAAGIKSHFHVETNKAAKQARAPGHRHSSEPAASLGASGSAKVSRQ